MPTFDKVNKGYGALATAAVALAGAVSIRLACWARSRERCNTIKSRLRIASLRADCQVLRMRQACAMGRIQEVRRYPAYAGLRAGMQAADEELSLIHI
eukprot:13151072-Alexandrium_andersonii.AAC.1